jgi:hypothetical protein
MTMPSAFPPHAAFTLLNQSKDVFVIADTAGVLRFVSPSAANVFGFKNGASQRVSAASERERACAWPARALLSFKRGWWEDRRRPDAGGWLVARDVCLVADPFAHVCADHARVAPQSMCWANQRRISSTQARRRRRMSAQPTHVSHCRTG